MKKLNLVLIALGLAMSSTAIANVSEGAKKAAAELGAAEVTELKFEKGKAALTSASHRELDKLVGEATKKGRIGEVHVAAWSDQEYPSGGEAKPSEDQVKLAGARAEAIRLYLTNGLKVPSVKSYNMTDRPNILEETFRTSDAVTKDAIEKRGATNSNKKGVVFDGRAQASTALVFLKFQQR